MNHFDYSIGADNDEDIDPLKYEVSMATIKELKCWPNIFWLLPSECLFSHAGLINTYLRNRFSPNTLEALTFLKDNIHTCFLST